jgi:3-methyl-2-oxobutanoate hydroxymethyltransferase
MDEMLHHARAVARGATRPLLVGDLPFLSYQADEAEAVRNAGRFLQAGMDAVKLEGGKELAPTAAAIIRAGIPVMGHVGLTPQSIHALGGWRVQGRTAEAARDLLEDALSLEDAGCFSLVLESMPDRLAAYVTERLTVPTIGIGAGPGTSGQVLVAHDLLGLFDRFTPKFVKRYAELGPAMRDAFAAYRRDVETHAFPGAEHSYTMSEEEWQAFQSVVGKHSRLRKVGR